MFVAVVVAAAIVGYCRGSQWLLFHRRQRCLGRVRIVALLHHHRPLIALLLLLLLRIVIAAAIIAPYTAVSIRFDSVRFIIVSRILCSSL